METPSKRALLFLLVVAVAFVLALLVFVNVISALAGMAGLVLGYIISEVADARNRRNGNH